MQRGHDQLAPQRPNLAAAAPRYAPRRARLPDRPAAASADAGPRSRPAAPSPGPAPRPAVFAGRATGPRARGGRRSQQHVEAMRRPAPWCPAPGPVARCAASDSARVRLPAPALVEAQRHRLAQQRRAASGANTAPAAPECARALRVSSSPRRTSSGSQGVGSAPCLQGRVALLERAGIARPTASTKPGSTWNTAQSSQRRR